MPDGTFTPYRYQQDCITRIMHQPSIGLFLDCGLGKTVITLTAVANLKDLRLIGKVLVIAPKKVAESTWTAERDSWGHLQHLTMEKVIGSKKAREEALERKADIYLINREMVTWLVEHYRNAWPFDMVVIDESSSFKSHTAKRFKALAKVRPHITRIVELTGTPSPNGMADLWSQIYLLDGGQRLGRRFSDFRNNYFTPGRRNGHIIYEWNLRAGSDEDILKRIGDICVSMRSEDYLELPDLIYDDVPVSLGTARKKYDQMEKQMVLDLPEEDSEITALSAAALSGKLLQLANGAVYDEGGGWHEIHAAKLEALDELLEQIGGNVLLFYQYRHDAERILDRYPDAVSLAGDEEIQLWNDGRIRILLAHPASAGYGLNLQRGGYHIVWFGLTWNLEQYIQANKRLHRQGQSHPVVVHHLISQGTLDEEVLTALKEKKSGQDAVIDALKAHIAKKDI